MVYLDYLCGCKLWHPEWMQRFATPKVYLMVYGLLGTIQAMSHMYIIVTLTTMEKRFAMPSETTAIILSGNEISQILLSVWLSHYGGKRNRIRWIACGTAFCALSCFIIALPHLIYGAGDEALQFTKESMLNGKLAALGNANRQNLNVSKYDLETTVKNQVFTSFADRILCNLSRVASASNATVLLPSALASQKQMKKTNNVEATDGCSKSESVTYVVPLILVFLSQFVLGIGTSLYYALGQTYLDDSASKRKTPLMLACAMTLRMIGPIIGFFLGYGSLNIFIDMSKTATISRRDPRWLGAWWFGWLILGGLMLLFAFLIGLFPTTMPRSQDRSKLDDPVGLPSKPRAEADKALAATMRRLLSNKLLMCNIFSGTFYLLGALGYMTFLAKIMEVQFFKSRRDATIIIGPMIVVGMAVGFILSGVVISRRKPNASKLLMWNIFVGVCHLCFIVGHFFIYCEDTLMPGSIRSLDPTNACNSKCLCNVSVIEPICDPSNEISYMSACHAGCQTWNQTKKAYGDCICLVREERENRIQLPDTELFLTPGRCLKNCATIFMSFAVLCMSSNFLVSTGKISNILVSFRAIAPADKSVAQGLTLTLVSLLASIPGPIIYGKIIDLTCLRWNVRCGQRGNCQFYDQKRFRYYVNSTGFCLTLIGLLFDVFVWHYGKNLNMYAEENVKRRKEEHIEGRANEQVILDRRSQNI